MHPLSHETSPYRLNWYGSAVVRLAYGGAKEAWPVRKMPRPAYRPSALCEKNSSYPKYKWWGRTNAIWVGRNHYGALRHSWKCGLADILSNVYRLICRLGLDYALTGGKRQDQTKTPGARSAHPGCAQKNSGEAGKANHRAETRN